MWCISSEGTLWRRTHFFFLSWSYQDNLPHIHHCNTSPKVMVSCFSKQKHSFFEKQEKLEMMAVGNPRGFLELIGIKWANMEAHTNAVLGNTSSTADCCRKLNHLLSSETTEREQSTTWTHFIITCTYFSILKSTSSSTFRRACTDWINVWSTHHFKACWPKDGEVFFLSPLCYVDLCFSSVMPSQQSNQLSI